MSFISQVIRLIDNILEHFIFVLAQNATEPTVNATEPATEAATQPSTGSVAVNATEGATTEPPPDSK